MRLRSLISSAACAALLCACGEEGSVAPPASAQPAPSPTPAQTGASTTSMLAILAHPDDELLIAPTLASYARQGADVTLILVTRGDLGPGSSGLPPGPQVAALRSEEARCAADALGIDLTLLDFGDGSLISEPRKAGSAARQLLAELGTIIASNPPDIIVTFGPDGTSGHADHRIVNALVTQLVQSLDAPRPALLYTGIRNGTLPAQFANSDEPPGTVSAELLTAPLAYTADDLAASQGALDCYVSQFSAADRGQFITLLDQTVWGGSVHYREAFDRIGPDGVRAP